MIMVINHVTTAGIFIIDVKWLTLHQNIMKSRENHMDVRLGWIMFKFTRSRT